MHYCLPIGHFVKNKTMSVEFSYAAVLIIFPLIFQTVINPLGTTSSTMYPVDPVLAVVVADTAVE